MSNIEPKKSQVVAIMLMGVVKDGADANAAQQIVDEVTRVGQEKLDTFTIDSEIDSESALSASDVKELIDGMGSLPGASASVLMAMKFEKEDALAEQRRLNRTPEEIEHDNAVRAAVETMYEKNRIADKERAASERAAERHVYFDTAEKWAGKDVNAAEAAHGVAHDLYAKYGHTGEVVKDDGYYKEKLGGTELAADYGRLYDNIKSSNIQAKLMRSASDLFD